MAEFYEMPALSPTMEVGTIVEWRVKEGESFEPQTVIAEIGTDKANAEAEVFDGGVLIKQLVAEGDEAPPGFPIAIIGESADEDISALLKQYEQKKTELEQPKEEEAPPAEEPPPEPAPKEASPAPAPPPKPPEGAPERTWMGKTLPPLFMDPPGDVRAAAPRVAASPLARKVAAALGVDLAMVRGSGPGGRIVRDDVERAAEAPKAPAGMPAVSDEVIRHSPMRKTIAKRLLQSTQDTPTFTLTVSFDMQGFIDLRAELKARLPDARISYNDMLIMAVARALQEDRRVNASWGGKAITRHGQVNVGVAVAVPDGLITPVIRDADRKGLTQIAAEIRELAGRAREGKLQPEEYTGSTFTISNLGMYAIDRFDAIINPPDSAILAVGSIAQVPVAQDGELGVGWRMNATMTCDHRVIDGATGAEFLQVLRRYVEAPALLLT